MRRGLADEGEQPGERRTGGNEDRGEPTRGLGRIGPHEDGANDEEAGERDADEDGRARMDEQHLHSGRRK
jgi:hypothetical protein